MDAMVADWINASDAKLIAAWADMIEADLEVRCSVPCKPWCWSFVADVLMSDDPRKRPDQAWLISALAARVPGIRFDGCPADADWDNMICHLRAEIEARRARNPKALLRERGDSPLATVV